MLDLNRKGILVKVDDPSNYFRLIKRTDREGFTTLCDYLSSNKLQTYLSVSLQDKPFFDADSIHLIGVGPLESIEEALKLLKGNGNGHDFFKYGDVTFARTYEGSISGHYRFTVMHVPLVNFVPRAHMNLEILTEERFRGAL